MALLPWVISAQRNGIGWLLPQIVRVSRLAADPGNAAEAAEWIATQVTSAKTNDLEELKSGRSAVRSCP